MTLESNTRKLSELRVIDLKAELEKRQLDCSGVKAVLVKKLEKALRDEGENPETYRFNLDSGVPLKNSRMTSVASQVQTEELNRTVAISCISVPTRPLPSVWCKWVDGRICIATQTPIKCARSKWRPGRKPKGSPPSVDPYTGLEIFKDRDCSNDDYGSCLFNQKKVCRLSSRLNSVEVQVEVNELLKTSEIVSKNITPHWPIWCRWVDGRISISTQTPKKRPRIRNKRVSKEVRLPPLVDPMTNIVISDSSFSNIESAEGHEDSCKMDLLINSKGVQVCDSMVLVTSKIICKPITSWPPPSKWCKWPDSRICCCTQTPIKRLRLRSGRIPKGRPPLVNPWTCSVMDVSDKTLPQNESSTVRPENKLNGDRDGKSDDERHSSDDEATVKPDTEELTGSAELSDDEKQDDESATNDLSDDEKQDDEEEKEDQSKMSDDEKRSGEEDEKEGEEIRKKEEKMEEDEVLSDDQIEERDETKEDTGDDNNVQSEGNVEDCSDLKNNYCPSDEKKYANETSGDEISDKNENYASSNSKLDKEFSPKKERKESEKTEDENETSQADMSEESAKSTPKKLRPRITAPTDDGNSTKTPVLKKDISLPAAKPKDEEFVVPEKESDIYDKEKFIVKDDTMGDTEDTIMDFEVDMANMDNEDSINLTIGEEDTKFMTEEAGMESEDKDAMEVRQADKKKGSTAQESGNKQLTSLESEDKSKAKSLWVSGLSSATRATDLKHLFTKHGKVIAAKIVTNAKTPGARCYGFVTMANPEDANACIKALNLTELHGRLISVEPVADKPASKKTDDLKKSPHNSERDRLSIRSNSSKRENIANGDRRHERHSVRDFDRRRLSRDKERDRRNHGHRDILSFEQIKAERKKQKMLAVEREMRELDRRKRDEISRQRDIERRNREEALRLEREREKLKYERERMERERAELLLLERARLEREKEELKRQKLRLEEDRKLKRCLADREDYGRSKRPMPDYGRHYSSSSHHRASPARHYDRSAEFKKSSRRREKGHSRDRYPEISKHEEELKKRERFSDRSMGSKRDERKEHRRSRSPRRRSRDRPTSSKSGKRQELTEESAGRKCYYCGLASHSRRDCPAMDVPCPICGKPGHFGSMCSVLGYKYPEPIYFEGYKNSGNEKWPQGGMDSRTKNDVTSSWGRSSGQPANSDRWSSERSGSLPSGSSRLGALYPAGSSLPSVSSSSLNPYPQERGFDSFNRKY